jgi:hypothetical protein
MTTINYYPLHPDCYELFTTERFHSLLKNNPDLELVEESYDKEKGEATFTPIFTLISEQPAHNIALIDRSNENQSMWVVFDHIVSDHLVSVENPSKLLIKALTVMDEFLLENRGIRLFETNTDHYLDDNRILRAEYDFEYGDYDLESGIDWSE